jgi:DNA repair photolyase
LVAPQGLPLVVFRGRGATVSPPNRFALWQRDDFDDGWEKDDPAMPRTELIADHTKSAITRNDSPDLPFAQSVNPYRGCEHGCAYCFARPSHAYLGYSPGLDFETRIVYKPDIAPILRRELARASYRCQPLAIGTNTDAWQPAERQLGISRALLEVCLEACQPVQIITKSALVLRDLDLLKELARQGLVQVTISLTGLAPELSRRLEPRAASPKRRLEVIGELARAEIPVGLMFAPAIPGLNDHDMEAALSAAAEAGAGHAAYGVLRLPDELAPIFRAWLAVHAPERAKRIMAVLYDLRGGSANDPRFGHRLRGLGHFSDLLEQRFRLACRRLGLDRPLPPLDCGKFRKPRPVETDRAQLGLF